MKTTRKNNFLSKHFYSVNTQQITTHIENQEPPNHNLKSQIHPIPVWSSSSWFKLLRLGGWSKPMSLSGGEGGDAIEILLGSILGPAEIMAT